MRARDPIHNSNGDDESLPLKITLKFAKNACILVLFNKLFKDVKLRFNDL